MSDFSKREFFCSVVLDGGDGKSDIELLLAFWGHRCEILEPEAHESLILEISQKVPHGHTD